MEVIDLRSFRVQLQPCGLVLTSIRDRFSKDSDDRFITVHHRRTNHGSAPRLFLLLIAAAAPPEAHEEDPAPPSCRCQPRPALHSVGFKAEKNPCQRQSPRCYRSILPGRKERHLRVPTVGMISMNRPEPIPRATRGATFSGMETGKGEEEQSTTVAASPTHALLNPFIVAQTALARACHVGKGTVSCVDKRGFCLFARGWRGKYLLSFPSLRTRPLSLSFLSSPPTPVPFLLLRRRLFLRQVHRAPPVPMPSSPPVPSSISPSLVYPDLLDLDLRSTQEGRRGACAGGKGAWVRLMSTSAASQAKDAAAKAAKGDREKKEVAITSRTLFACSALLWFSRFDYVTGEGSPDRSPWKMFEWQGGPIILAQVETGTWSRRWAAAPSRTPTGPPRWSSPLTPACRG
ncbi:uncharacterized protein LOC125508387 isoform X2 [Triticum urartu]|uniref:uncharacterized protein LOC125508387 isoform X2 n=1 Tax=Triticum urartu TaxID=4572 RepID=UPI002042CF20|nr:uncharacterized protein LOC125508387 isoform X2 [Triticum urartu]XP_048529046.1 uncharacterized protein LOC125508387 isoform X2 [Triticum urartu]